MFLAVIDAGGPKEQVYLEDAAAQVALNLENPPDPEIEYYEIRVTPGTALLNPVTIKGGPRSSAPAREVVEIEAGGQDVGSAIVEA